MPPSLKQQLKSSLTDSSGRLSKIWNIEKALLGSSTESTVIERSRVNLFHLFPNHRA